MREKLEKVIGWGGLVIAVSGYLSSLLGLASEPLYVFWLLIGGFLLSAWSSYTAETDMEPSPPFPIPNHVPQHTWSAKERGRAHVAAVLCAVTLLVVLCVEVASLFNLADVSEQTISPVDRLPVDFDYETMRLAKNDAVLGVDLVDATRIRALAKYGKVEIIFDITKRSRLPWVQVRAVELVVESYEPRPERNAEPAGPVRAYPTVYIANITKEVQSGKRVFPAWLVPGGEADPEDWDDIAIERPTVFIEEQRPEQFIVKINATEPGIYKFHVRVTLTYLW